MKARLATEIGTRVSLRVHWGAGCPGYGYHNAHEHVIDIPDKLNYNHYGGDPELYPDELWPVKCDSCGQPVPKDANRQVFNRRLYDTPSGELEPGNIYYEDWLPENLYWDNHTGPQLCAILPDGRHWNIDSRALNCQRPNDRTHRCWCRHGEPPNITVDKIGNTCAAGAGSIQVKGWHGFLQNGVWRIAEGIPVLKVKELKTLFVDTIPENLEEGIIYVSMKYRMSIHLCACGCREKTPLSFSDIRDGVDTGWQHTFTEDGKVTTRPSIGNWRGEKPTYHAHYYITENRIEPC